MRDPLRIKQLLPITDGFTVLSAVTDENGKTAFEDLTKEVEQLKESVEKLTEKLNEIVLPVRATKDDEGLVRAISNIKNLEVSTATIPTIVGAFNTLLLNLRSAGIIQM